jgi:hypothetical protein
MTDSNQGHGTGSIWDRLDDILERDGSRASGETTPSPRSIPTSALSGGLRSVPTDSTFRSELERLSFLSNPPAFTRRSAPLSTFSDSRLNSGSDRPSNGRQQSLPTQESREVVLDKYLSPEDLPCVANLLSILGSVRLYHDHGPFHGNHSVHDLVSIVGVQLKLILALKYRLTSCIYSGRSPKNGSSVAMQTTWTRPGTS